MKYDHLCLLDKHLKECHSQYAPFYFIISKELYEIQEAVQLLLNSLSSSATADHTFDASQLDESRFWMELEGFSFFVSKQVIWIQQAEKLKKSVQEKLEKYFLHPFSPYLIFSGGTSIKQQSFYPLASEKGIILELPEIKSWEKEKKAIEWVKDQASIRLKIMAYPVCQLFVKQVGVDYSFLAQEMDKLLSYCEDQPEITSLDVQAICCVLSVDSVFQLGEAVFKGDVSSALNTLHGLLADQQMALPLIRQLRSQFQVTFQVALLLAQNQPFQEITKEFPYMKGVILDKQIQQAKNYGLKALQEGLLKMDKTDSYLKNSLADPHLLTELLIIQLCNLYDSKTSPSPSS